MGYPDFPDEAGFIQLTTTDEVVPIGQITIDESMELSNIILHVQKVGTHTNETLTLEIHNTEDCDNVIYSSDTYSYNDFSMTSSHWAGIINFDFDNCPLNKNISYWVAIKVSNYSYTDDVQYIGVQLDWPEPINTPSNPNFPSAAMGIYGYVNA